MTSPTVNPDLRPNETFNRREVIAGLGAATVALATASHAATGQGTSTATGDGPSKLREVREIENVWIPMSDGTRIAARIWLPVDAEKRKVPAIFEYIPYRKRDGTRLNDDPRHSYWAARGYACVRPDIRGSGDSEGIQIDEYVKQEQDDGVEIVAWLAKQPWCTGKVGMVGISWGGFSALQVAARHPPGLKAIITHCSTDDRYEDDAHYIGGMACQDMFIWGSMFFTIQAQPPDPAIVGERWRGMWLERLNRMECRVVDWLRHQHRDAFWKHGSINQNFGDIRCPVYAISGWVDPYSRAIPRLLAGLKVARKVLIGPWYHAYPNEGLPGPTVDYLEEALRWWDYWLKGVDTGIMREPMYRVWMQQQATCYGMTNAPGRWVAEDSWPSPRIEPRRLFLRSDGLGSERTMDVALSLAPSSTVGVGGGHWCAFDMDTELPKEQRIDDARSLTFDSGPLPAPLEILGAPVATLELAVDRPVAMVAVRLTEVAPDTTSRRVTYGVLNLTHHESHEHPEPLVPGKRYRIKVQMRDIAHSFGAGNRIRVAVSTSYWPMVWTAPEAVKLTLFAGSSEIELPVRAPRAQDAELRPLPAPPEPKPGQFKVLEQAPAPSKSFETDMITGRVTMRSRTPQSRILLTAIGTERGGDAEVIMEVLDSDPGTARLVTTRSESFARGDWQAKVESYLEIATTRADYHLTARVVATDKDGIVMRREWQETIARQLS